MTIARIGSVFVAGSFAATGYSDYAELEVLSDGSLAIVLTTQSFTPPSGPYSASLVTMLVSDTGPTYATIGSYTMETGEFFYGAPEVVETTAGGYAVVYNKEPDNGGGPTVGDAFGRAFNNLAQPVTSPIELSASSAGEGELTATGVKLSNGNYLALWSDSYGTGTPDPNTVDFDIRGRLFDTSGNPIASEFTVNTSSSSGLELGATATLLSDNRVMVAWGTGTLITGPGGPEGLDGVAITGRFLDATGTPTGSDITLHTFAAGYNPTDYDFVPQIIADGTGGFWLAWSEDNGPNDEVTPPTDVSGGLYLQHFNSSGASIGAAITVHDFNNLNFTLPPHNLPHGKYTSLKIVALPDGSVVVTFGLEQNNGRLEHIAVYDVNGLLMLQDTVLESLPGIGPMGDVLTIDVTATGDLVALTTLSVSGQVQVRLVDIDLDFSAPEVYEWREAINGGDSDAAPATTSQIIVLNGDNTRTHYNGSFVLGPDGPTSGTLTNIELRDFDGTLRMRIENNLPTIAALNALMGPIDDIDVTWEGVLPFWDGLSSVQPISVSSSRIDVVNSDGSRTVFLSTANDLTLDVSQSVIPLFGGTVSSIEHRSPDGLIVFQTITAGLPASLGNAWAGVFGDNSVFFDNLDAGANTITSFFDSGQAGKLYGGLDGDTLVSSAGYDIIDYARALVDVTANLATGTVTSTAGNDTIVGTAEGLSGGRGDDTLTGNNLDNVIKGRLGDDSINGAEGNDELDGGEGHDTLVGALGNDTLIGGEGYDRAFYLGSSSAVSFNMAAGTATGVGPGNDTLIGIEAITGSNFGDTYVATGYTGTTTFPFGPNRNTFEGRGGNDTITGNGDTQISYFHATAAVTVDIQAGTASGDTSVGSDTFSGVSFVTGSAHNDTLLGSTSNDQFNGLAGNDSIDGRGGFDRASYINIIGETTTGGISVDMAAGQVVGNASVGTDTLRSIEAVRGTSFDDTYVATGFGTSGANVGSNGTFNEFEGHGGNDTITGNGNTRLSFAGSTAGVIVDIQAGTATGAAIGSDLFSGVNALNGSTFNDTLRGSTNATGTSQDFDGRGGDDLFDGRGGFDRAVYNQDGLNTAAIQVQMAAGIVTGGALVGTDTLRSIESVRGTNFADTYDATGYATATALNIGSAGTAGPFGTTVNEFEGLGGNDTITGSGDTRVSYASASGSVTVDLAAGTGVGNSSVGSDVFLGGVTRARGSNFNDVITGNALANILEGQSGGDQLSGGDGNDTFAGGEGDDTIEGGLGADSINGDNGVNTALYGTSNAGVTVNLTSGTGVGGHAQGDVLFNITHLVGSNHADALTGNVSANSLSGGLGNDNLVGGDGDDTLLGGDNDDTLGGGVGADSLNGGNGSDWSVYVASTAGVTVNLTAGTGVGGFAQGDVLVGVENVTGSNLADVLTGSVAANILDGLGGNDNLVGGDGNDSLFGGENDDTLGGGVGADSLVGGNGSDWSVYVASTAGVTVNLTSGTGVGGFAQGDVLVGIENVQGSNLADVLTGSTAANILDGFGGNDNLVGGDGNDSLFGGEGNDTLGGGVGADSLVGGNGSDWSVYVASTAGVTVNLTAGTGVGGYAQGDILVGVENVQGSNLADVLTGSVAANILDGLGGNDNLVGGDGNDSLYGGENDDTLGGGVGADSLVGGNGIDWSVYVASTAGVTVNLTSGTGVGGFAQGDILVGVENVQGSNQADVLTGSVAANILDGLGGNDNLVGGDGNDSLFGGEGNDTLGGGVGADSLVGGNGSDWSVYVASTAGITVNLSGGAGVGGFAQGDIFVGIENIVGSVHADFITGNTAANTFDGGAGNDTLVGGAAADVMAGGADADVFRFGVLADSGTTVGTRDVILDFVSGQDKFGVVLIDAITGGGDDAFTFVGTGPFTAAGQVRYRFEDPVGTVDDKTIVEFNVDGVLAADMTIELRGLVTLAANDFLL